VAVLTVKAVVARLTARDAYRAQTGDELVTADEEDERLRS